MASAFQRSAFQDNAFQIDDGAVTAQLFVPGHRRESNEAPHYPKPRDAADVRRDRDALWAANEPASKVIEKAAQKVISRAQVDAEAGGTQFAAAAYPSQRFDPLDWLMANQERQRLLLEKDLSRKRIDFDLKFWILLKLEIERQWAQNLEDEAILMMLMEI